MEKYNCSRNGEAGFSLIEVMVATALFVTALAALGQMFTIAASSNIGARATTFTTVLAEQKMEQLRSLTWSYDPILMAPVSDITTDTTATPERPTGGTGLAPSPSGALMTNTTGYVDYLGPDGTSLGGGPNPPPNTAYVRRWSIEPLPTNPNNTLIIQVLVIKFGTQVTGGPTAGSASPARGPDRARVVSVRTRNTT